MHGQIVPIRSRTVPVHVLITVFEIYARWIVTWPYVTDSFVILKRSCFYDKMKAIKICLKGFVYYIYPNEIFAFLFVLSLH